MQENKVNAPEVSEEEQLIEQARIRREKFYDKDSSSKIRRKPRRNIYLFNPEDLDNDNIISMVETIPTFQRSKEMLDNIQAKTSNDEAQIEEELKNESSTITF